MEWQSVLMKRYGVDGQCFYHYWFKDGRQILEQPAQKLLQWKELDMPFCFCWANESWARTWSQLRDKNPWANTRERDEDRTGTGILLEQKYGEEEQWRKHFDYLLPFFKDERYIKEDNKPVFLIYKVSSIPCLNEMLTKWRRWAKESGLAGLHIIGANSNHAVEASLDSVLQHEPQHTMMVMNDKKSGRDNILKLDYDEVWKELLGFHSGDEKTFYEGFVGYDDTPRRGREGIIIENASPESFRNFLTELLAKNAANQKDITFLNAWNEWGEGMYLEPDMKHSYAYLEAIPYAKEHYLDHIKKYTDFFRKKDGGVRKEIEFWSRKSVKYESYWKILDAWLFLKEEGRSLEKYFLDRGIHSIAVYGMGMLGKHLWKELENGNVKIEYIIDRKADALHMGTKIYSPEEDFPKVGAIVVTATYDFMAIQKQLNIRGYDGVISLDEIVMDQI